MKISLKFHSRGLIQTQITPPIKLRMIDLFAGTGAFTTAFEETGKVVCVYANDISRDARLIYDQNHRHPLHQLDINQIKATDIPPHDILTAGFPCQPFSIAGSQKGFADVRSNVFWKILEIIDHHQPRGIVLENVKNLKSHDHGETFRVITSSLEQRGYHLHYEILNTSEITGIPQHRERIYIVCLKPDLQFSLDFPTQIKRSISDFLETTVDVRYHYTPESSIWSLLESAVTQSDTIYQFRRVYVRENKSRECPTLTANMGTGGHNVPIVYRGGIIRKLTPRECFNLQGFPSTYTLNGLSNSSLYQLVGNAVSLPVVRLIAQRLVNLMV